VVCHIQQGTQSSTDGWFKNPQSQVSAHYGIGVTGAIYQWVREEDSAWANGIVNVSGVTPAWLTSLSKQGVNINTVTISLEHEGYSGNAMPEAQYQASLWVQKQIIQRYNIPLDRDHIIGHYQVDYINKSGCPGSGFPWSRLMIDLNNWATDTSQNTGGGGNVTTPTDSTAIQLNGHTVGHGFLARYLELGGGDFNTAVRNIGFPLTEEVTGPDGLTRQVFERYVMEYDPKETNDYWKVRGAFAGAAWLDENKAKLNLDTQPVTNPLKLQNAHKGHSQPIHLAVMEKYQHHEQGPDEAGENGDSPLKSPAPTHDQKGPEKSETAEANRLQDETGTGESNPPDNNGGPDQPPAIKKE